MRLAVLSSDRLQVFDNRNPVAEFAVGDNLTADDVETARTDRYGNFAPALVFPQFGMMGQPSAYTGA